MVSEADSTRLYAGTNATDPFYRLLAQDDGESRRFAASFVLAIALYAGCAGLWAAGFGRISHVHAPPQPKQSVELIDVEPPPPPPPEPEKEPEPPKEAAPAPKAATNTPHAPVEAPPPPAQAGKVLTADPDPDAPLDLTGEGFVQGTADTYAGGVTTSAGTSKTAVYGAAKPEGTGSPKAGPVGNGPIGEPGVDRSRPASPKSGSWNCGFPAEADIEQINYARVTLAIKVRADGRAENVSVVQDPGNGFGALAKRCAERETFSPALNKAGEPVTVTQVVTINFRR